MNITSIQKHYDKLSTVERFAAMNAALARGDESELAALRGSCPKKTWSIATTRGIFEAFDFLAMFHLLAMQENAALYWLLFSIGDDEVKMPGDETWVTMVSGVVARSLSRHAAWVEVCKEYGADSDELFSGLPGADSLKHFTDMLTADREVGEVFAVAVNPQPYAADYRAVIENRRAHWE